MIFVAGTPLRGASIICFELSIKKVDFLKCDEEDDEEEGICCDEKV